MKHNMHNILPAWIAALCLMAMPLAVNAAEAATYTLPTISESAQQTASQVIDAYIADTEDAVLYAANENDTEPGIDGYRIEDGIQVYYTNFYTGSGVYAKASDMANSNVSLIPYENEDGCGVISIRGNEYCGRTIEEDEIGNPLFAKREEIEQTIAETFRENEILSLQYVQDFCLNAYAVQIETKEDIYVIPYFDSIMAEKYSGITEGAVYTFDEVQNWANQSFEPAPSVDEEGNYLYGTGLQFTPGYLAKEFTPVQSGNPWLYVGVSALVLACAAGVTLIVLHSKKQH